MTYQLTARHEAAHAVAAIMIGERVKVLQAHGKAGHCELAGNFPTPAKLRRDPAKARHWLFVLLAGYMCEERGPAHRQFVFEWCRDRIDDVYMESLTTLKAGDDFDRMAYVLRCAGVSRRDAHPIIWSISWAVDSRLCHGRGRRAVQALSEALQSAGGSARSWTRVHAIVEPILCAPKAVQTPYQYIALDREFAA
ncbi:MAG: hypothetical protein Q8R02_17030 [Hyphomonadaceae bacterium]|nr:hypothetical protein [Hyphomonadaceae bacterium]